MTSNYKTLGDYIQLCNEKNLENEIPDEMLRGISNRKHFQKAKTNTIGVDLSKYRIVRKGQFAFNRATTRNGDKISIALRKGPDCIVSPSYRIFKSKDENVLNSEYLMMWFRRPEFDRYARYKSHGSAHEFFDYDEMCEVELPIPSIEKQREIVKEYNTVTNRIKLNEQLNQKLEETAQALYRHWFVDFEFPNKEGKPYKSSGGEMVYNEELDKEIPVGWEVEKIGDVVENLGGGTPKTDYEEYWTEGNINWYSPTDITNSNFIFCEKSARKITDLGLLKSSAKLFPPYCVMMTSRATIGKIGINKTKACTNQGFITLIPNDNFKTFSLIEWLKSNLDEVEQLSSGSTFKEISKSDFRNLLIFKSDLFKELENRLIPIYMKIENLASLTNKLDELKDLLLSKMTMVEVEIKKLNYVKN